MYVSKVWGFCGQKGQEAIHSYLGSQDVAYLSLHPMPFPPEYWSKVVILPTSDFFKVVYSSLLYLPPPYNLLCRRMMASDNLIMGSISFTMGFPPGHLAKVLSAKKQKTKFFFPLACTNLESRSAKTISRITLLQCNIKLGFSTLCMYVCLDLLLGNAELDIPRTLFMYSRFSVKLESRLGLI
jgi:hypothetical protein